MFLINQKTDDLVNLCLTVKTQGFAELLAINLEEDTNLLVYIFSNLKSQFARLSVELKDMNPSISSVFKSSSFFEQKLFDLKKVEFEKLNSSQKKTNYQYLKSQLSVKCNVKRGKVRDSNIKWNQGYKADRFISFDQLLSSLGELEFNSYTYQVMALSAFENDSEAYKETFKSRMVLIELDKLKDLSFQIDKYNELSNLDSLALLDLTKSFIEMNVLKTNILNTENSLFNIALKDNFETFKQKLLSLITSFEKNYLNNSLNKLQLKRIEHPLTVNSSHLNGVLARSKGQNLDYNYTYKVYDYNELDKIKLNLDSTKSLYSYYAQILKEIAKSLDVINSIFTNSDILGECFVDYGSYDLNLFNFDSCFELENAHGLATIYLFKDSNNRVGYQLNTESFKRLSYYLEHLESIDIEGQIDVLEALDIKLQEIY